MLNIVVCVKAVPDPSIANKLKIDPVTKSLPRLEIPLVINSLDGYALEAALQFPYHPYVPDPQCIGAYDRQR